MNVISRSPKESIISQAITEASNNRLVVPYLPSIMNTSQLWAVRLNDFPISSIFSSYIDYSAGEIMDIQTMRTGGKKESFKSDNTILSIYGMMREGLVAVCNTRTFNTNLYTLNKEVLYSLSPSECITSTIMSVEEDASNIAKDSIHCIEVIPRANGKLWSFRYYETHYFLNKEDLVTYAAAGDIIRKNLMEILLTKVVDISYYSSTDPIVSKIRTTLSREVLKRIATDEVINRIMYEMLNESKLFSLNLPSINEGSDKMVHLFLPNIISVSAVDEYTVSRGIFNPYK